MRWVALKMGSPKDDLFVHYLRPGLGMSLNCLCGKPGSPGGKGAEIVVRGPFHLEN